MITTAKAFVTSDQKTHATLEDAQKHELAILLRAQAGPQAAESGFTLANLVDLVMGCREKVLDVLTTTASSKVRARKVNGGTKKRKTTPDSAVNRELQDGKQ